MKILSVDIGGSGIKANIVDTLKGEVLFERVKVLTPEGVSSEQLVDILADIASSFDWKGDIAIGFPGVVRNNKVYTAHNLSKGLIGFDLEKALIDKISCKSVTLINDADAAGVAEMAFGSGKNFKGASLILTIGTGIGSSLFIKGNLVPNAEFGHLMMKNEEDSSWVIAEKMYSGKARKDRDLKIKEWALEFNKYLEYVSALINPDVIILGGGISRKADKFQDYLKTSSNVDIKIARLENDAGIIGAAVYARSVIEEKC